jgi:hypothetical protein
MQRDLCVKISHTWALDIIDTQSPRQQSAYNIVIFIFDDGRRITLGLAGPIQ